MAFAGVDHRHAGLTKALDQPLDCGHDRHERPDIIAKAGAKPARLYEIALHVDHHQGGR